MFMSRTAKLIAVVGSSLCFLGLAASSAQIPIQAHKPYLASPQIAKWHQASSHSWRFDQDPLSNATSHFIFDTVSSLLQAWSNTRYRNGHTIVPATIPVGTLLYHGTSVDKIPPGPEWIAFDSELSSVFCQTTVPGNGCWHLTLMAKRSLKILYFDGSSAAKMYGPLDAQDLIAWGDIKAERTFKDTERIEALCEWGKKYELDGFLRMQSSFEVMLCSFTEGVETVSFLNLITDVYPSPPKSRSQHPNSTATTAINLPVGAHLSVYRSIEAGLWHNQFPGESRVQLDLTRLISFYDTDIFPSLTAVREGQERWDHRLQNISTEERGRLIDRLDEVLGSEGGPGSEVDWMTHYRVVKDQYAERLEVLRYILNTTEDDYRMGVQKVQAYIRSMLFTSIINGVEPEAGSIGHSWAIPVFEECATAHTRTIASASDETMTPSERLLLRAVQDVSHEICRVFVGMWAQGVELGILDEAGTASGGNSIWKAKDVALEWSKKIDGLMTWLDWSVWVKCRPPCGVEEVCYLPTWPFFHNLDPPIPGLPRRGDGNDTSEWLHPHPRCYRKIFPFQIP